MPFKKKRNWKFDLSRFLLAPISSLFQSTAQLFGVFGDLIGWVAFPFRRGRRNREFEKSGRQRSKRDADQTASGTAIFRKGERERLREQQVAERRAKKMLRKGGKQAEQYLDEMAQEKAVFSRGNVVQHLAQMQSKADATKKPPSS